MTPGRIKASSKSNSNLTIEEVGIAINACRIGGVNEAATEKVGVSQFEIHVVHQLRRRSDIDFSTDIPTRGTGCVSPDRRPARVVQSVVRIR